MYTSGSIDIALEYLNLSFSISGRKQSDFSNDDIIENIVLGTSIYYKLTPSSMI